MPTRFRMLYPGGALSFNSGVKPLTLVVQGHNWEEEPFVGYGEKVGDNRLSQHFGAQILSPYESSNFVLNLAGGRFGVAGDYLFHSYQQESALGTWGLLRVTDAPTIRRASVDQNILSADGFLSPSSKAASQGEEVTISAFTAKGDSLDSSTKRTVAKVAVEESGTWRLAAAKKATLTSSESYITAESARPTNQTPVYVKVR
jgi:hypothetical protein